MDASSGQHQEMANHSLENVLVCPKTEQDRKPRPQPEQALKCPRCESTNTKFCYYNNYSLSQPRYFCKSCRRYWTKGGTLRNVPVGGGCRKNKRSSSSAKRTQDQSITSNHNPFNGFQPLGYDSNDLSVAFARLQQKQAGGQLGYEEHDFSMLGNHNGDILGNHNVHHSTSAAANSGILDALRSGFLDTNGFQNLYNYGIGNGNYGEVDSNGASGGHSGEMVMPYEDISTVATTSAVMATTMKQEMCNVARENENRILWGFPWQFNGEGNMNDLASYGILNSPLM